MRDVLARVHAPLGFEIGAETPDCSRRADPFEERNVFTDTCEVEIGRGVAHGAAVY